MGTAVGQGVFVGCRVAVGRGVGVLVGLGVGVAVGVGVEVAVLVGVSEGFSSTSAGRGAEELFAKAAQAGRANQMANNARRTKKEIKASAAKFPLCFRGFLGCLDSLGCLG